VGESGGEKTLITESQDIPSAYIAEGLGDTKPVVVIGGKTDKFVPNVNLSFKCGADSEQYFINFNRPDVVVDSQLETVDAGAVSLSTGGQSDCFYVDAEGRLKWDIVFDEKPSTNVFKWKIRKSPGVSFHYQGELSEEDIAEGCSRPDWAVGSYAVYGDKSDNGFMTGKLMHIPRPFCIDATGVEQWADILIADGWLTITIPQDYLDSCVYPMRLDPTLGMTTCGASSASNSSYTYASGPYTAPEDGTADSVSAFVNITGAGTFGLGYYLANSAPVPYTLKGASNVATQGTGNYNSTPLTLSLTSGGKEIVSGEKYYPAFYKGTATTAVYYDDVSGFTRYYGTGTAFPDPFSYTASSTRKYSTYITYTAAGGGTTGGIVLMMNHFNGGTL